MSKDDKMIAVSEEELMAKIGDMVDIDITITVAVPRKGRSDEELKQVAYDKLFGRPSLEAQTEAMSNMADARFGGKS